MRIITTLLLLGMLFACREASPEKAEPQEVSQDLAITDAHYPDALKAVFEAHGGLGKWRKQRTLSYKMPSGEGSETHTIDLWNRMDLIEGAAYSLGYDGAEVWLKNPEGKFERDAIFYHNLIFYFYAMPFVLADDGILYGETEPLEHGGVSYPGIRIGYEGGVGASPEDEYYLYYNPDSHKMEWLGYTVTYFSQEDSDDVHWIRYSEWMDVNGLSLPKTLTWYNYEDGLPTTADNPVTFEAVELSEDPKPANFYAAPEGSEIVRRENPQ